MLHLNFEYFRYMDEFVKNDTLKYHISNEEDINDIKNLIEFVEGLVIKDSDAAMEKETILTNRNAMLYISAMMDVDSTLTEYEKQVLINSYKEGNPYYIELKEEYGIDYITARMANDYTILGYTRNSLTPNDRMLFEKCYKEAVEYFVKVLKNPAFSADKLNKNYFRYVLIFFASQKWITCKMERYFNPDLYTEYECKNTFISYGIDYFDSLPLEYKRKVIKSLSTIISYKGTDKGLEYILKAFGLGNIEIFKYVLSRTYNANGKDDLILYQVPLGEVLSPKNHPTVDMSFVTRKDPLWQCTDDEILEFDFNAVTTKYISVGMAIDSLQSVYNISYMISIIEYLERNHNTKEIMTNFSLINKKISENPITLYDLVVAITKMVLERYKKTTVINHYPTYEKVYGFNLNPTDLIYDINYTDYDDENNIKNITFRELIKEIQLELLRPQTNVEYQEDFEDVYDFFVGFSLENFESQSLYTEQDVKNTYNSNDKYKDSILKLATNYKFQNILDKFENNSSVEHLLLDILEFFSLNIVRQNIDIEYFKKYYEDLFWLLAKYNIFCFRSTRPDEDRLPEIFKNDQNVYNELKKLMEANENEDLLRLLEEEKYDEILNILNVLMTNKRTQLIQEGLTVEEVTERLKHDNKDILYYNRLNCYLEMFTKFNIVRPSTYTIEDFSEIMTINSDLRDQLERYIMETNNAKLYKLYLTLYDTMFQVDVNKSLYAGYEKWDDLLATRNPELSNYVTIPESAIGDEIKIKEWRNNTLYELCDTLDTFIDWKNTAIFSENPFIGSSFFISNYIYMLVMIFKAYTTELISGIDFYKYDRPVSNTIKLIDDVNIVHHDTIIDHLEIEDLFDINEDFIEQDKFDFEETINIYIPQEINSYSAYIHKINNLQIISLKEYKKLLTKEERNYYKINIITEDEYDLLPDYIQSIYTRNISKHSMYNSENKVYELIYAGYKEDVRRNNYGLLSKIDEENPLIRFVVSDEEEIEDLDKYINKSKAQEYVEDIAIGEQIYRYDSKHGLYARSKKVKEDKYVDNRNEIELSEVRKMIPDIQPEDNIFYVPNEPVWREAKDMAELLWTDTNILDLQSFIIQDIDTIKYEINGGTFAVIIPYVIENAIIRIKDEKGYDMTGEMFRKIINIGRSKYMLYTTGNIYDEKTLYFSIKFRD